MPAGVGGLELFPGPAHGPRLLIPRWVLGTTDEIEQLAAAQPVDNAVILRPAPDRTDELHEVARQLLARHGDAPSDVAGVFNGRLTHYLPADCRLDAVRADQRIS